MAVFFLAQAVMASPAALQYSFTIWDWEATYRDMTAFRRQVDDVVAHGFNLLELGVSWADSEPSEGQYDFSIVDERVGYALARGLALRLRVNLVARPAWFRAELYQFPDGTEFQHFGGYPSVFNAVNRARQHTFAESLARHFSGQGFTYTPGFSVHMEVKFGDWVGYEPSARAAFRQWLLGRYGGVENLNQSWKTHYAHFGEIEPPVPAGTEGKPWLQPIERDWIQFREEVLADWVAGFAAHVRRGDPTARISVPLGESFRRQSAAFANLGYWTFSRHADEIVHSYDFFWHGPKHLEAARVSVATMTGITQKPTIFEIDGPYLLSDHGYTPEMLVEIAQNALDAGAAGIQVSNWGSSDLSQQKWMTDIAAVITERRTQVAQPTPKVLYYVSKWQQYAFREPTDWLYDRQFAFWHALHAAGMPVRVVSDENLLNEDLRADFLVLPCVRVIDDLVRDRIRSLSYGLRAVGDEPPGTYDVNGGTRGSFGAKVAVTELPFSEDTRAVETVLGKLSPNRLRVAAVQFRSTSSISENVKRMKALLRDAADQSVRVAVFPEMALTGYSKREEFLRGLDWSEVERGIEELCNAAKGLDLYIIFGAPSRDGKKVFCSAYAIAPSGDILDVSEKNYLAGEAWATAGRTLSLFVIDGVRCGTFICHDERYGPLVQLRALSGAQLFFYLSCESGLEAEYKLNPYRAQVQARAVENGVYIVHANTPGGGSEFHDVDCSHGHSRIVAPDGNLLGEMSPFEEGLLIRDIDLSYARSHGLDAALKGGRLASWMKKGLHLVQDKGRSGQPPAKKTP